MLLCHRVPALGGGDSPIRDITDARELLARGWRLASAFREVQLPARWAVGGEVGGVDGFWLRVRILLGDSRGSIAMRAWIEADPRC